MRRAALIAALAMSAGVLAACSGSAPPADLVSVSNGGCGDSWHLTAPGWHTFQVYNSAAEAAEVDLVDPANRAIYAEVAGLGPATSSPMRLNVGSGSYAFRCLFEDSDPITGPTSVVGGHASGTPAILPVTSNDLLGPAREYHAYVAAGLNTLVEQADAIAADVRGGHLGAARGDWLTAHLTYERLGAAYDAFGPFDDEIDGRPDGLAGGVDSPQWTGFYRLEYGLWHGQSAHELTGVADTPAVSFLKAPAYQDGHAGYSNPIDDQTFLVNAINQIQKSKDWKSTAIVVTYDDSDGWYDHQVMPIVNGSNTSADTPFCSSKPTTLDNWTTRCGFGQRLPMLVISPWTRRNFVSSNLTNTVSVTKFIEDNWLRGQRIGGGSFDAISGSLTGRGGLLDFRVKPNFRPLILNPTTGKVVSG